MKYYIPCFIILFFISVSFHSISQINNSSFTINAASQSFHNETISFEWCIAEALITNVVKLEVLPPTVLKKHVPEFFKPAEFPKGYINVFPAVTKDFITLLLNIAEKGNVNILITDVMGKPVMKHVIQINEMNVQNKIPVRNFTNGFYFLHILFKNSSGKSNQSIFKFIKV